MDWFFIIIIVLIFIIVMYKKYHYYEGRSKKRELSALEKEYEMSKDYLDDDELRKLAEKIEAEKRETRK